MFLGVGVGGWGWHLGCIIDKVTSETQEPVQARNSSSIQQYPCACCKPSMSEAA